MSATLRVQIEQSLSLPRALDDNDLPTEDGDKPHPGHRYFTPQPDRKKPLLPPKPGTAAAAPTPIRRRSALATIASSKSHEAGADDAADEGAPSPEAEAPGSEVEDRGSKAAINGQAAETSEAESSKRSRLTALRASSGMEPLAPKRKAPGKPSLRKRRTSDTHLHLIEQLKRRNESFQSTNSAPRIKRHVGNKVCRSASSAGLLSDSSHSDQVRGSRPQFFTPQPTRRKFNLVSRTPSNLGDGSPVGPVARLALKTKRSTSSSSTTTPSPTIPDPGHSPDIAPAFPIPHTPVSPLAAPAFVKTKLLASQSSSDSGINSDMSSSPSPQTPLSPLAVPAFGGRAFVRQSARAAPPVPDPQHRKLDFHQLKGSDKKKQWTTPEKSHALSKEAITRLRPCSTPGNIRRVSRGGSVSKSKQRQSAARQGAARQLVVGPRPIAPSPGPAAVTGASGAGRQRHRSAPAGRAALANTLSLDPMIPVKGPSGEEAPLNATLAGRSGVRRRHASDSLRKEVLRSVSMERSRKMSLLSGGTSADKENAILTGKAGADQPDSAIPSLNGGSKSSFKRFQSRDNGSVYSDYPSTFSATPTHSPTRQRPRLRRGRSSRTSLGSLKSMFASNEFLNDIFLSDRKSHRKLKGVVGALVGLVLGGCLFLAVHYALDYGLFASIAISSVGTIIMCLSLAFTVRARCVATLMVPTLCTSRGRAAFLAIIVTLLLTGPIDNVYTNAKEASDSMSCSAELARNQTILIKDAAREVFDVYVRNLMKSVQKLQKASEDVKQAFQPVDDALNDFLVIIGSAGESISMVASMCKTFIDAAYKDCSRGAMDALHQCQRELDKLSDLGVPSPVEFCDVIKLSGGICNLLKPSRGICDGPVIIDKLIDEALKATSKALDDFRNLVNTDVDFSTYWETRYNQSRSLDSIQAAVQQELEDSFSFLNTAFSVVDKIVALSIVFLLVRSYQYHSKYRTKDRFDNFYVTDEFKRLDEKRKEAGRDSLLPLKKSERRRLIDLSSLWLSKPEKGLFRVGLRTVLLHAVIAAVLILADYGLFWLLSLISRHGKFKFQISGGGGTDLTIGGTGILSQLIQDLFVEGFAAASEFDIYLDTDQCLPRPTPPNEIISVGIGVLYLIALLTVLSQAYALRVRRRIASYFYPERELERISFLYNNTLHKRQSIFKLLKQRIRQTKHEQDVERRISFTAYLSAKYPCWRRVFRVLGREKRVCLGCADLDNGTFKSCANPDCSGLYCNECLHEIGNTCTLCQEIVVGSDLSIGVVENRV